MEISHIFLKHCEPIKEIDGQPVNGDVQNMAMDYVINAMLIDACIGKMPDGGLYEPQYAGQTWLKVYRELMKMDEADRPKPQPWGGKVGAPEDGNGNLLQGADLDQHNANIDQRVFQAAQVAKAAGKLPSSLEELVEQMRQSRSIGVMFSTVSSVVTSLTTTWRKPQRRQWFDNDIYMPSIERMGIGDVVVAVDTSGSVATHELQQFLGELNRISEDHKPRFICQSSPVTLASSQ